MATPCLHEAAKKKGQPARIGLDSLGTRMDARFSKMVPGPEPHFVLQPAWMLEAKSLYFNWVRQIGLDPAAYGTHSMRRTKASLIYRRTKNLRAVQLLLGHAKVESTVRYLGIEVDDALEMAEDPEA